MFIGGDNMELKDVKGVGPKVINLLLNLSIYHYYITQNSTKNYIIYILNRWLH